VRAPAAALAFLLAAGTAAADYSGDAKTLTLLAALRSDYGFSEAQLDLVKAALKDARSLPKLIESDNKSKEKVLSWDDYRPLHVNAANLANGLRFMQEQKAWLDRAGKEYGVAPEVITALLGVETKYGAYTGRFRVLDALATLGYQHPTRAPFFFDQLTQFFVLCRDDGFQPVMPLGSYAGAMGEAQFMPSVYRSLAVDFDGDGRRDLWSAADAIGSVANYLVHFDAARAWHPGQPLIATVKPGSQPLAALMRNAKYPDQTIASLRAAGVSTVAALPDDLPAGLIELDRANGPEWWIGLPNFYSVMSYNPRVFYAMSVTELAAGIYDGERAEPPPAVESARR
jgi:membrane-bound lytic murein transglycosylase B